MPRIETAVLEPPSMEQVEISSRTSLTAGGCRSATCEQTGMRIGELHSLEWRDCDLAGSRFRIRDGKTATARPWIGVPEWLMEEIAAGCPPDDRTAERRVFPGFTPDVAKNVMARACKTAGIPHFHPHDLRHRYASVQIDRGVPVTKVAGQLGHSRKSLTLDIYSHVLLSS